MKDKLVEFNRHIIHQLYIEIESCVIKTKNVEIFKDTKIKKDMFLPKYE